MTSMNSKMWGREGSGEPGLVPSSLLKMMQILLGYCWNLLTALVTGPSRAFHNLFRCGVTGMSDKILDWNIVCRLLEVFCRLEVGKEKEKYPSD